MRRPDDADAPLIPVCRCSFRKSWLAHYLFESISEVQEFATKWLWTYNHERPNMALGGITPKQKLALAA